MSEPTPPRGQPADPSQGGGRASTSADGTGRHTAVGPRHAAVESPEPPEGAESPVEPAGATEWESVAVEPAGPDGDGAAAPGSDDDDRSPAADPDGDGAAEGGEPEDEGQPASEDTDSHGRRVLHWREQTRKRTEKRKRPWWIEIPALIVIAFILTFLIQTFVARVYYVPSGSMEHTLHGTTNGGDRILAFKMLYDFRNPEQGEVVVFKGPPTWYPEASIPGPSTWFGKAAQALGSVVGIAPPNEKDYVKRVIAVGGQTISCCDEKGRVQVDGVSLHEPYIFMDPERHEWDWVDGKSNCDKAPGDPRLYNSKRCFGPYKVPKGTIWVMGDHRSDSADSSYNCRGLVPSPDVHCQGPIPVDDVIGKAVFIVMPPSRWGTVGSPDIMHGAT